MICLSHCTVDLTISCIYFAFWSQKRSLITGSRYRTAMTLEILSIHGAETTIKSRRLSVAVCVWSSFDEKPLRNLLPRGIAKRRRYAGRVAIVSQRQLHILILLLASRKNNTIFFVHLHLFLFPLVWRPPVRSATVDLAIIVIGVIRDKQNITPFLRASRPFSVSHGLSFMHYRCIYVCMYVCVCVCAGMSLSIHLVFSSFL